MGTVIGRAAVGLEDSPWAVNSTVAAIGAIGEKRTEDVLNPLARREGSFTVLHDVAIPVPGFSANIDHVVVYGRRVLVIDTKAWSGEQPYWSCRGRVFRGWQRFAPAEKISPAPNRGLLFAVRSLVDFLRFQPLSRFDTPLVVVWPASARHHMRVRWLRLRGVRVIAGHRLHRELSRRQYLKEADPAIVNHLASLVATTVNS